MFLQHCHAVLFNILSGGHRWNPRIAIPTRRARAHVAAQVWRDRAPDRGIRNASKANFQARDEIGGGINDETHNSIAFPPDFQILSALCLLRLDRVLPFHVLFTNDWRPS